MSSDMDLDSVGCPICLEILVEPITMPCKHRMCKPCFVKNLELTNLHCPFCKKRIGTWCRTAKKVDSLVDQALWQRIQKDFQSEVAARLKGTATTLFNEGGFSHDFIFEDGVIGREFEDQMKRIREEEAHQRDKEILESEKLIAALQREELNEGLLPDDAESSDANFIEMQKQLEARLEQQKKDEELARALQDNEESTFGVATRRTPTRKTPAKAVKKSNSSTKAAGGGPRQMTLEETLTQGRKRKRDCL